jgi:ABC-type nitrate/sulfonate/bicarbonate transport system ATPase subunit
MTEIVLQNVFQDYKNGDKVTRVIDDVSLTIKGPSINMLLGPSGCGKSTLLRMMGGVRPQQVKSPSDGAVFIDTVYVDDQRDDTITVFQKYSNRPDLTARQNVEFPFTLKLWKKSGTKAEIKQRVDEILEAVGLTDKQNLYPYQLSGGQQQRVAIAMAMVLRPNILLMDEPFGALDPQTREEMQKLLVKLYTEFKCTVIFVTHDIDEAVTVGDRVIMMSSHPGKIVDDFTIDHPRPVRSREWVRTGEGQQFYQRIAKHLKKSELAL